MSISSRKIPVWLENKLKGKYPHDVLFAQDVTRFVIEQLDALDLYDERVDDPAPKLRGCTLKDAETIVIKEALVLYRGNITKAAMYLGIGRSTLERAILRRDMKEFLNFARIGESAGNDCPKT